MSSLKSYLEQYEAETAAIAAGTAASGAPASRVNYLPVAAPKTKDPSLLRRVGDFGVDVLKAVPTLVEAGAGLAGMVPGVHYAADPVGKVAGSAADWLGDTMYSGKRLEEEAAIQQRMTAAQDTSMLNQAKTAVGAYTDNPYALLGMVGQSGGLAKGGAMLGKAVLSAVGKPVVTAGVVNAGRAATAAQVGEGLVAGGLVAANAAQENPDEFAARYYGLPAGALTTMISRGANKLMPDTADVDTLLAGGMRPTTAGGVAGTLKNVGKMAFKEGVLEEALQSGQEQIFTNASTDQPLLRGVGGAMASGAMAGSVMGGMFGFKQRKPAGTITNEDLIADVDAGLAAPPAPTDDPTMQAEWDAMSREFAVKHAAPNQVATPFASQARANDAEIARQMELEGRDPLELTGEAPQADPLASVSTPELTRMLGVVEQGIVSGQPMQGAEDVMQRIRDVLATREEAPSADTRTLSMFDEAGNVVAPEPTMQADWDRMQAAQSEQVARAARERKIVAEQAARAASVTPEGRAATQAADRAINMAEGRDLLGDVAPAVQPVRVTKQERAQTQQLNELEQRAVEGVATPQDMARMQQLRDRLTPKAEVPAGVASTDFVKQYMPRKTQVSARLATVPLDQLPDALAAQMQKPGATGRNYAPVLAQMYADLTGGRDIQNHASFKAQQASAAMQGFEEAPTQGRIENVRGVLTAVPRLPMEQQRQNMRATEASAAAGQSPAAPLGTNIPEVLDAVQEQIPAAVDVRQPAQAGKQVAKGNTQGTPAAAKGQAAQGEVNVPSPVVAKQGRKGAGDNAPASAGVGGTKRADTGRAVRGRARAPEASDSSPVAVGATPAEPAAGVEPEADVTTGYSFKDIRKAYLAADKASPGPAGRDARLVELTGIAELEILRKGEQKAAATRFLNSLDVNPKEVAIARRQAQDAVGRVAAQEKRQTERDKAAAARQKALDKQMKEMLEAEGGEGLSALERKIRNARKKDKSADRDQRGVPAEIAALWDAKMAEMDKLAKRTVAQVVQASQSESKDSGTEAASVNPNTHTMRSLAEALVERFGEDMRDAILLGRVKLVTNQTHLAAATGDMSRRGKLTQGMYYYNPKAPAGTGTVYFVAANLAKTQQGYTAFDVALHEIGEHAGMEQMLGKQTYAQLMASLRKAMGVRTPKTQFEKDVAAAKKKLLVDQQGQPHEVLAYMIQHTPDSTGLQKMWAAIKAFAARFGLLPDAMKDAATMRVLAAGATAKWLNKVAASQPTTKQTPQQMTDLRRARAEIEAARKTELRWVAGVDTKAAERKVEYAKDRLRQHTEWLAQAQARDETDMQERKDLWLRQNRNWDADDSVKEVAYKMERANEKPRVIQGIVQRREKDVARAEKELTTAEQALADLQARVREINAKYDAQLAALEPGALLGAQGAASGQGRWDAVRVALQQLEQGELQLNDPDYGFEALVQKITQAKTLAAEYPEMTIAETVQSLGGSVVYGRNGFHRYGLDELGRVMPIKSSFGDSKEAYEQAVRVLTAVQTQSTEGAASGIADPETRKIFTNYGEAVQAAKGVLGKVEKMSPADWKGTKLKVFRTMAAWITKHHMVKMFDKWFNGALAKNAEADTIQQAMSARTAQLFNEPHNQFKALPQPMQEKIARLMELTEMKLDPRKLWDAHTHLQGLTGTALAQAKDYHNKGRQWWGQLDATAQGVYNDLAAMNEALYTMELAVSTYNMVHANAGPAKDLPVFKAPPTDKFLQSGAVHGSIEAAHTYWKNVLDGYTEQLDKYVAEQRGLLPAKAQTDPDVLAAERKMLKGVQDEKVRRTIRAQLRTRTEALTEDQKKVVRHLSPLEAQLRMASDTVETFKHAPYFHLGRFGDEFVSFRVRADKDGVADPAAMTHVQQVLAKEFPDVAIRSDATDPHVFARFESVDQAAAFKARAEALQKEGWLMQLGVKDKNDKDLGEIRQGTKQEIIAGYHTAGPNWLSRVVESIQAEGFDDAVTKQMVAHVRSLYLDSLPDTAAIKVKQKREGRPGWHKDMMRNYAHRMRVGSNKVASLAAEPTRTQSFADMNDALVKSETDPQMSKLQQNKMYAVVSELQKRDSNQMSVPHTPGVDMLRALNHAYFLGMSPSYLLIQMTQLGVLAWPELAKKHGFVKAAKALGEVSGTAFKVVSTVLREGYARQGLKGAADMVITGDMLERAGLSKDDAAFLVKVMAAGKLDIGNAARNVGRVAEGEAGSEALKIATAMGYASEILTRTVAALAAKRLHKGTEAETLKYAISVVDESMMDYSTSNEGRMMGKQGVAGVASTVMFSFMKYQAQLLEKLYREVHAAAAKQQEGESDKAFAARQKEARTFLGGHLMALMALAGSLGLPFATVVAAVADNLCEMFGDGHCDSKTAMRNMTAEVFGHDIEPLLSKGVVSRLAGFDVSDRAGEGSILPFSKFLADKRAMDERLKSMAMDSWGAPTAMIGNALKAVEKFGQGDLLGGMQEAVPSALKGPIKAYEMSEKGYTDKAGNVLPMTPGAYDILLQVVGLNPGEKADYQQAKFAQSQRAGVLGREATQIRNKLASAIERNDTDAMQKWLGKAQDYDAENVGSRAILPQMGSVLQQRARARALASATGTPLGLSLRDIEAQKFTSFYRTE